MFNIAEILEMAVKIEENGGKFYEKAASVVDDPAAKKLLTRLAAMEEKHADVFSRLKAKLEAAVAEDMPDAEGQAAAYLGAMADDKVFGNLNESPAVRKNATPREIFDAAIQAEKDSVVFYATLKDAMPKELGRDKVNAIIAEEVAHIAMLIEEKNK